MTAMGSLRVGIAVDSTRVSGYVIDLLKSIVALGGVRLAVVMTPRPGFGASDVSGVDAAGPGPSGRHVGVSGAASALAASLLRAEATTVRLAGRLLGSVARVSRDLKSSVESCRPCDCPCRNDRPARACADATPACDFPRPWRQRPPDCPQGKAGCPKDIRTDPGPLDSPRDR
jgi:hypothetical protein